MLCESCARSLVRDQKTVKVWKRSYITLKNFVATNTAGISLNISSKKIPTSITTIMAGKSPNISSKISPSGAIKTAPRVCSKIAAFGATKQVQNVPVVTKITWFVGWIKWSPTVVLCLVSAVLRSHTTADTCHQRERRSCDMKCVPPCFEEILM